MKYLFPLILITSTLFSQDVLTTLSGKTYKGEYVGVLDAKKILFKVKGNKTPSPIVKHSIKEIILKDGTILIFYSIMKKKDGSEIKGNWVMTSLDSIKFIRNSDAKTVNFNINDIEYIEKEDGTFIDLSLVTNPNQQDEWEKRKYIAELLKKCEENKEIKIMVMPIKDDFYGITEIIEHNYDSLCYNIIDNEKGLEYLHKENINSYHINDFQLKEAAKFAGANIVIYGFAYTYDVPFKYSPTSSDMLSVGELWTNKDGDIYTDLFNALGKGLIVGGQYDDRSKAINEAGTYVNLTYFALNLNTGEKSFIVKNLIVLKIG